jgi:hypothetical protein
MAFGGAAADALFGAGSGNVLTKITKWATGIFFAMALILGLVNKTTYSSNTPAFEKAVEQQQQSQGPVGIPPGTPPPVAPTTTTNTLSLPAIPSNSAPSTPQPK